MKSFINMLLAAVILSLFVIQGTNDFGKQAESQALDDVIICAHPQDEIGLAESGSTPPKDRK
jgi:hypothetical protein